MATYVNDLRLKEIATGDESGTWGTSTNTNLELIGEALGFGTEGITTNADTHTTTVADGSTDPGRAMYLKYTGTLDSACTITIAPNTISRMQFIENGTSGSQNIIISQGSGANITIPPGDTKAVYLDGAGSGAAVVDAFASLNTVDLKVEDDLTVTDDASIGGDATITGTLGVSGLLTANANVTLAGTTPTLTIGDAGAEDTKIVFDGNAQDFYIALDDSADDLLVGLGSTVGTTPIISITEAGAVTLKNVGTGDDNPMSLTLQTSETDIAADDVLGKISFQAPDEGTGTDAILVAAAIQAISEGDFSSSSNATSLAFMTGASEAATSKMTLSSGGDLTLLTAGKRLFIPRASDAAATGSLYSPSDSDVRLSGAGSSAGELQFEPSSTSGVAMTIDSSGNVGIGDTTPDALFHVATASGDCTVLIEAQENSSSREPHLQLKGTNTSSNPIIEFGDSAAFPGTIEYENSDNSMIFGTNAGERVRISSAGLVGIGTSAPHELLHVEGGDGTQALVAVKEDTATATASYMFKVDSTGTDVRKKAGLIFQRDDPGTRGTGVLHICVDGVNDEGSASVADSKMAFLASGEVCVRTTTAVNSAFLTVQSNDNGGIVVGQTGTNAYRNYRHVVSSGIHTFASSNNTASLSNAGAWTNASDVAYKKDIVDTQYGLETIKALQPRDYKLKADDTEHTGFIAQELETVLPQFVIGEEGHKNVNYAQITAVLTKAMKELEARVTTLEG